MSIRTKVILPYLLLTLLVAVIGVYVVTKLVSNSLTERLNNQLLEAGRVVSDNFVVLENEHVNFARGIAFTRGVVDAFQSGDQASLFTLIAPIASTNNLENIILIDMQGQEVFHLLVQSNGTYQDATNQAHTNLTIAQTLIQSNDADHVPQRQFEHDSINNRLYYFTALPLTLNNKMLGTVVIGTSLETILPQLKTSSLANVILYGPDGVPFASTITPTDENVSVDLTMTAIPKSMYDELIQAEQLVIGENVVIANRKNSIARGPLQVGNDRLAVMAVVLPSNFVLEPSSINRNTYIAIFFVATIFVIFIGYVVAKRITTPLNSLVVTSQAIADGDLTKRTGIQMSDEVGTLAKSFDKMTESLQERTFELKRTNKILEQMDRTKASFISISAHELRTPLTLIQGYIYMLEQMSNREPELAILTKGLSDGYNRMEEVVNSMLDVTRIDNKSLKVSKTQQKIHVIISKVQKNFASALEERKQKLKVEGVDSLPLISADPELLYKLFHHLIMNAIKYTPDGGSITISGRTTVDNNSGKPMIEIAVQDTGIGIDPQYHELVFEKFYQTGEVLMHSSGKTKFKGGGPGLGLAIARGIVEAHEGEIWLDSPGYDEQKYPGTTVYVRLPYITKK